MTKRKTERDVLPFKKEMGELLGKHDISVVEYMEIAMDFFAYMAIKSGDPTAATKYMTEVYWEYLEKYNE